MSMSHLIILGIIALIVIPPEKLPEMARQFARILNDLKRSADQIMGEIKQDALFKPDDIIDQNIKDKITEIQNQLNNNTSQINQSLNHATHVSEMPALPQASDLHETSSQDDVTNVTSLKKNE